MHFMILLRANPRTDMPAIPANAPTDREMAEMGRYNGELLDAGVLLAAHDLHPTSNAARINFSGGQRTVVRGPFPESHDPIIGFWLWELERPEDAIEWAKRAPLRSGQIEIREAPAPADLNATRDPASDDGADLRRAPLAVASIF